MPAGYNEHGLIAETEYMQLTAGRTHAAVNTRILGSNKIQRERRAKRARRSDVAGKLVSKRKERNTRPLTTLPHGPPQIRAVHSPYTNTIRAETIKSDQLGEY